MNYEALIKYNKEELKFRLTLFRLKGASNGVA